MKRNCCCEIHHWGLLERRRSLLHTTSKKYPCPFLLFIISLLPSLHLFHSFIPPFLSFSNPFCLSVSCCSELMKVFVILDSLTFKARHKHVQTHSSCCLHTPADITTSTCYCLSLSHTKARHLNTHTNTYACTASTFCSQHLKQCLQTFASSEQ